MLIAGAALGRVQVVVAHQQDHGNARVGHALDAPCELALEGRVRLAHLVRVAREHEDVDLLVDRIVDHVGQPAQKVHGAAVHPRVRVDPAVVLHADMQVRGVEELDGLHHIL